MVIERRNNDYDFLDRDRKIRKRQGINSGTPTIGSMDDTDIIRETEQIIKNYPALFVNNEISYNKLWKLLIDRGIKKKELQEISEISAASIAKLGRNGNVTVEVLVKVCQALNCEINDICEIIRNGD